MGRWIGLGGERLGLPVAATCVRAHGSQADRSMGNLIGTEFLHHSSRALNPQLHTHFTLSNCTEERWKALQTGTMFGAIHYATEVYRNELARRLHVLEYETVRTPGRMDGSNAFELKGVPQPVCARVSKRFK